MHAIPIKDEHISLIKGNQGWRYDVNHRILRCKENLRSYEDYFLQLGFDKTTLLEVITSLPHLVFKEDKQSYLHADLYSRHVVMNPETFTLTGVIDWGGYTHWPSWN